MRKNKLRLFKSSEDMCFAETYDLIPPQVGNKITVQGSYYEVVDVCFDYNYISDEDNFTLIDVTVKSIEE